MKKYFFIVATILFMFSCSEDENISSVAGDWNVVDGTFTVTFDTGLVPLDFSRDISKEDIEGYLGFIVDESETVGITMTLEEGGDVKIANIPAPNSSWSQDKKDITLNLPSISFDGEYNPDNEKIAYKLFDYEFDDLPSELKTILLAEIDTDEYPLDKISIKEATINFIRK